MKSYNTISNAISMAELEHGSIETWIDDKNNAEFDPAEYIYPYIKNSNGGVQYAPMSDLGYKDGMKYFNGDKYNFTSAKNVMYLKINDGSMIFRSGFIMGGELTFAVTYYLIVDINGAKEPNIVGQDIFIYELPAKSGYPLKMYGEYNVDILKMDKTNKTFEIGVSNSSKEDIIDKCKNTSEAQNAKYCGAWIKLNGWKIPEDYPYL